MTEIFTKIQESIKWDLILSMGLQVLLIILLGIVLHFIIIRILRSVDRSIKKRVEDAQSSEQLESTKRAQTIARLIKQGALISIWITLILVILNQVGVKIGPILAGAGILGLAVGFGSQNLVRDVISGFFIIIENQVRVGDVAIINGTGGLVDKINFRTIILRDLKGTVHIIPNGAISSLSNLTNEWSAYVFEIGVAYKENTDHVCEVLKEVFDDLLNDNEYSHLIIEEPEIFGVDKFADSSVVIKGRLKTRPIQQWHVGREFLRRVKLAFDERGIEIPFPHTTLYMGEETKPLELRILDAVKRDRIIPSERK